MFQNHIPGIGIVKGHIPKFQYQRPRLPGSSPLLFHNLRLRFPSGISGKFHTTAEILHEKTVFYQLREGCHHLPDPVGKGIDTGHIHGKITYQHALEHYPVGKNEIDNTFLKNRRQLRKRIVPLQGQVVSGTGLHILFRTVSQLVIQPVLQMVQPHLFSIDASPHDPYQIISLPHHRRIYRPPLIPQLQIPPICPQPQGNHHQNQQENHGLHRYDNGGHAEQGQHTHHHGRHIFKDGRQLRPLFGQQHKIPHFRLLCLPIGHPHHTPAQEILQLSQGSLHPDTGPGFQNFFQHASRKGKKGKSQNIQQNILLLLPGRDAV